MNQTAAEGTPRGLPGDGDLHTSRYTRVSADGDDVELEMVPVKFDIVSPGESLITGEAAGQPLAKLAA
jgi:fumarate reductase flavoprotein subunit